VEANVTFHAVSFDVFLVLVQDAITESVAQGSIAGLVLSLGQDEKKCQVVLHILVDERISLLLLLQLNTLELVDHGLIFGRNVPHNNFLEDRVCSKNVFSLLTHNCKLLV